MVTLIFISDPRLGQVQVKKSNFEIQNFLLETYLSCPVLSQDSKSAICFEVRELEMPKMRFKK